jgi:hypothetical protein
VRRALAALLLCGACGGGLPMNPCTVIGAGGVGGFGGQGGFTDGGGIGGGGGFQGSFQAMLTGTAQSIALSVEPAQVCNEGKTPATRVTTKVLGPDNLPVEHMNNGASNGTSEFDPYSTTITFTPTQPGDYHFVAQFEPNLGIAQLDLIAAVNFTSLAETERFASSLIGNGGCSGPAVTASGALICGNTAQMPHTYRDGGAVGDIMAQTFAVQGNTVWAAWSDDLVTRYVDTGSGPLLAQDTFTLSQPIFTLVPIRDDAVLVVTAAGAERWERIDGGFVQEHVWTLGSASVGVQGAAIDGDSVLVATSSQLFESADGGNVLEAGPALGLVLGFGPDGIWALKSDDFSLALYRPGGGPPRPLNLGLSRQDMTPPSWDMRPWSQQADFYFAYYDAAQDELFLSDYGDPGASVTAGHDWIILLEPAGDIVVKKTPAP